MSAWRRADAPAPGAPTPTMRVCSWRAVDMLDQVRVTARARRRHAPRRSTTALARRTWAARGTMPARPLAANVLRTHHLLEALRATRALPARWSCQVPQWSTRPSTDADRRGLALSRPPIRTASASSRRRCAARRAARHDDQAVLLPRAFNHAGPRQDRVVRGTELRAPDRRIEAGLAPPVMQVGQPRGAARHHRRARHGAGVSAHRRARTCRAASYNVCSGTARPVRDVA